MKQVVFIAGTAYSGTTMLDMMLGNSTSSFSTGEVKFFFEPINKYHINPSCHCGDDNCRIWRELKKTGKHKFYGEIFNRFDKIETIIDSSKDLFWISERKKELLNLGIDSRVLLIWKKPEEFAFSRYKRNSLKGWQRAWINYHRLFFSLNRDWWSIRYCDLATNPTYALKRICSIFSMPYSENMEYYWNKKHHMLFGNSSAKYHSFDKNEKKYKKMLDSLTKNESNFDNIINKFETKHRKISYDPDFKKIIPESVFDISQRPDFLDLISFIKLKDVNHDSEIISNENAKRFLLPKPVIELFKVKRQVKEKFFYLRNRKKIVESLT
jgi:hypothetical protein